MTEPVQVTHFVDPRLSRAAAACASEFEHQQQRGRWIVSLLLSQTTAP